MTSRFADTVSSVAKPGPQFLPLARVQSSDGLARSWRVTLGNVRRVDGAPHLAPTAVNPGIPGYVSAAFTYDFGLMGNPQTVPKLRANGVLTGGTSNKVGPFVELAWGMETAQPFRLIAHWPMQGGSVVVHGSYVELFGGFQVSEAGTQPDGGSFPTLTGAIVPDENGGNGVDTELGLEINAPLVTFAAGPPPVQGAGFYVPDFARRARIIVAQRDARFAVGAPDEFRVPVTGYPDYTVVWYDDQGRVVWTDLYVVQFGANSVGPYYREWLKVPARATMMGVYAEGAGTFESLVNWCIAP